MSSACVPARMPDARRALDSATRLSPSHVPSNRSARVCALGAHARVADLERLQPAMHEPGSPTVPESLPPRAANHVWRRDAASRADPRGRRARPSGRSAPWCRTKSTISAPRSSGRSPRGVMVVLSTTSTPSRPSHLRAIAAMSARSSPGFEAFRPGRRVRITVERPTRHFGRWTTDRRRRPSATGIFWRTRARCSSRPTATARWSPGFSGRRTPTRSRPCPTEDVMVSASSRVASASSSAVQVGFPQRAYWYGPLGSAVEPVDRCVDDRRSERLSDAVSIASSDAARARSDRRWRSCKAPQGRYLHYLPARDPTLACRSVHNGRIAQIERARPPTSSPCRPRAAGCAPACPAGSDGRARCRPAGAPATAAVAASGSATAGSRVH